jgi:hypothetical protein
MAKGKGAYTYAGSDGSRMKTMKSLTENQSKGLRRDHNPVLKGGVKAEGCETVFTEYYNSPGGHRIGQGTRAFKNASYRLAGGQKSDCNHASQPHRGKK